MTFNDYIGSKAFYRVLSCKMFKELLHEPKILQCGEDVCGHCILNHVKSIPNREVKCPLCGHLHDMPMNKQFPNNKAVNRLLELKPIGMSEVVHIARVKKLIEDLELNKL
jgi:hypothetical protein